MPTPEAAVWLLIPLATAQAPDPAAPAGAAASSAETSPPAPPTGSTDVVTDPATPEAAADPDAGWTDLPPPPGDFGSALDPLTPDSGDRGNTDTVASTTSPLQETDPHTRALARGRFGLRPRVSATGLVSGPWGVALGASAGHQWWMLSDRAVRGAGETRLDLGWRVGGVSGVDLRLTSAHGAWMGPVGVFAGPALRLERLENAADRELLSLGLTVGPQVRLVLDLGPLLPWAAVSPAWVVAGRAGSAEAFDRTLDRTLDLGLDLQLDRVDLRFSGALREPVGLPAATPTLFEATFGLAFHF